MNRRNNVAAFLFLLLVQPLRAEDWGYTEPRHMVKMSFAESGVIDSIRVTEGDKVEAGQLLAQLDVGVISKEIEISRELLKQRQFRAGKLEELARDGKAAQEELDRAQSDLNIERLKIERGEAQIRSRSILAPFAGTIIEVRKDAGESVNPNSGVALTLVHLSTLVVSMHLPRARAATLSQGATRTLHLPAGEGKVRAVVDFISPVEDPATKTIHVKFSIDNASGRIPSGARVTLDPPAGAEVKPKPRP